MEETLPRCVRFGPFSLDLKAGELRAGSSAILLQEQPLQVLRILIENEGTLVSREEIRKRLWPNDTIVEFEHSINAAINKLRKALGDPVAEPQYIQTVARRGYRLMVPVEWVTPDGDESSTSEISSSHDGAAVRKLSEPGALTGRTVSHYRVLDIIGGGGMGVVYRAEDLKLGRRVALKFLPEELGNDSPALQRFELEARIASSLNHHNICAIYEFGEHDGLPFLVMESLEGETLRDCLSKSREKGLPLAELLDLSIQVTDGLQAAHEKGIIHRDIKPANIFLTSKGVCKILDFGLAKLLEASEPEKAAASTADVAKPMEGSFDVPITEAYVDGSIVSRLTRTGLAIGTAGYMSPEQVNGEKLDARTDLFSFGLVLYEMATGQRAFTGKTAEAVHDAILNQAPLPVRDLNSTLPPELETIIKKSLEKDRDLRYQSAAELRAELEKERRGRQISVRTIPNSSETVHAPAKAQPPPVENADTSDAIAPPQALPTPKPARWTYVVAVAVILVVAAGALYWFLHPRTPVVTAIRQLTHTGHQKFGYVMTDGTRIYFAEIKDGKSYVAEVSTAGGEVSYLDTQLDNPAVQDISPSGSELMVGTPGPLWIVPLPAGPPRRISGEFNGISFLPGSSQIAYVQPSDFLHLFASDIDGGNAHPLLQLPRDPVTSYFVISPDGSAIRYSTADGKIWESRIDGTQKHLLSQAFRETGCLDWAAGNKLFLVISPKEGVFNVWAISESGWLRGREPQPVQLTFGPVSFPCGVASKDGKQIYALGRTPRGELSIYDAQAGMFRKYLNGISAGSTDFSSDGQWVAYVTHPQGNLWRSRLDGSDRRQLTFSPMGPVLVPRWSPDGRFLAFMEWGEQRKIYLVSADGGAPMLLLSGDFQPTDPNWSPDGKFLAYAGEAPAAVMSRNPKEARSEIRILDLSTKQSKTVPGSQGMFSPRWSPDGHYLVALSDDQKQLFLYSFEKQHWQQLPVPKLGEEAVQVGDPNWSHDSRYLYFQLVDRRSTFTS